MSGESQVGSEYVKVSDRPAIGWVNPQIIEDRIDAHHFNVRYLDELVRLKSTISHNNLSKYFNITKLAGFEYTKYFDKPNHGAIQAITSLNVQDCYIDLKDTIYISNEIHELLERSSLSIGDIVLSYTGIYRRAAVIPEKSSLHLGPNVCVLKSKGGIDPYFMVSYLNCFYGQILLEREITISAQPTVNMNRIRELLAPIPPSEIQTYVGSKLRLAERCREEARNSLGKAKSLLIKSIGFDLYDNNILPAEPTSGKFYKITNRVPGCITVFPVLIENAITAERYSPNDLARDEVLRTYGVKLVYLGEIAEDFINGYDCREFKPQGTPYLKVSNIKPNELSLDGIQFISSNARDLNKKFQMICGNLLITRKGSFGISTTVLKKMENMAFSSEIIRIPLKAKWDSDYVALFLNTPFGRYQFDRLATGTTMKGINHENLADIAVPKLDFEAQGEIGEYVRKFMQLTEQAKDIISEAKSDVEKLIEGKLDTEGILSGRIKAPTWDGIEAELGEQTSGNA